MSTEQNTASIAKTAPRVTLADIEAAISSEHYFTAEHGVLGYERHVLLDGLDPDPTNKDHWAANQIPARLKLLTFCVLVLRNGFTVTGESACVSPENFDAEMGREIARENAIEKCWPLMGFALADRIHCGEVSGK